MLAAIWVSTFLAFALLIWFRPASLIADGILSCTIATALGAGALLRAPRLTLVAAAMPFGAMTLTRGLLLPFSRPGSGGSLLIEGLIGAGIAMWQLRVAASEISAGANADAASRTALRLAIGPGAAALLIFVLCRLLSLFHDFENSLARDALLTEAFVASVGAAVTALFCFVALPLMVRRLRFDEASIAQANRAREWFQRSALPQVFAQPRRALSASGIAAVLFALMVFDHVRTSDGRLHLAVLALWNFSAATFYGTAIAVFAAAILWLKSWRIALAVTLAVVYAATGGAWLILHAATVVRGAELAAPGMAALAGMVFLLAGGIAAHRNAHEPMGESVDAALSERADAVLCIGFAALLACLPAPAAILPVMGVAGTLVLFPALCVAIETVLPRYRTADEVFGRR